MANNRPPSPVPICAHLSSIEIVGDLENHSRGKLLDYSVVISVDDDEVFKSEKLEKKIRVSASRWEWSEGYKLFFHPSSVVQIKIYRKSRTLIIKHLVGEYTGKFIELLENDAPFGCIDKTGAVISQKLKIKLCLAPTPEDSFDSYMKAISANVSRIDNSVRAPTVLTAIGNAFELTKNIMDAVSDAHPLLKVSWTIMSAVYVAAQQTEVLDDNIRDLAENLRELLGIAKESPDLLVIKGTTNVIEEIGRTSLTVTSLIHEYTQLNFIRRTAVTNLFDDMKLRIAQCHKSCNTLKEKFDRRINMDVKAVVKEMKSDLHENNMMIRNSLNAGKDEQLLDKIRLWLAAPDSSQSYNDARKKHQTDTCDWFLNGLRFLEFQEKSDFLWIKGTAGCGKTILCSSIIAKIIELYKEQPLVAYAYFFFDGRDSQKDLQLHDKLIRSLILQLSLQCDGIPAALIELYGHGHQQPSIDSLHDTLYHIIQGFHSVYIIIDSLDECIEREQTLPWIEQLASRKMGNLHLVVASRPERDISDIFQHLDPRHIDVAAEVNHDIVMYLEQELSLVKKWDDDTRTMVKSTLIEGAHGMFRWVALQLLELKKCSSKRAVITQLKDLPKGLYETYDRILLKVEKQSDRTDTKALLRFLCFAARPMTLEEISEAVAVDFSMEDAPRYDGSYRYWDSRDVLEKCSGFIVESEGNVKLAHFSIKEYLLSTHLHAVEAISSFHLSSEELSHSIISQTCLVYLLQFDTLESLNETALKSSHLALYAAEHWVSHAKSGDIDKSESSLTFILSRKLFEQNDKAAFINWIQIWDLDSQDNRTDREQKSTTTPLYYASSAGLEQLAEYWLNKDEADMNIQGGYFGNALQAASAKGHDKIVKLLLEKGANVNAQGGNYGNALQAASSSRRDEIVKLLLENGADVNALGGEYGTALEGASLTGRGTIVEMLLEKGADINAEGGWFGNALQAASFGGHDNIVKLLLENGADVNALGGEYGTALQAVAERGHTNVVEVLLENGADVNAQGGFHGCALNAASAKGHDDIIKVFLDRGADVNSRGGHYGNAICAASESGHNATIKLLLDNGADLNAPVEFYGNALQAASLKGHDATVQLLIDMGADVNAQCGHYTNALIAASVSGHGVIAEVLLENGANVDALGGDYGSALCAASENGHDATVRLLLEKGANVNVQGGFSGNALQAASSQGHDEIVGLLLDNGADVNAHGGFYGNALQAAAYGGYDKILCLLLDKGANVNMQGGEHNTVLQAATRGEHPETVKLLLQNGADVSVEGGEYSNVLQLASLKGQDAIIKLLLEKGVDVNVRGGWFGSALQAASFGGHNTTVELLLENGADVNALGGEYGTALGAASMRGGETTITLLLKNGADVNAKGGFYENALQAASSQGHDDIIKVLLDKGANVNAHGGHYDNALCAASESGHDATAILLLDNGADVNARGEYYGSALQAASMEGHIVVVKLLLDRGADVNAGGGFYSSALQAASFGGHEEIVKLLLENGADVDAEGGEHGTALQAASERGHVEIVQALLEKGADVNVQSGPYGNALQAASAEGHDVIVVLLLDKGAEVNAMGGMYATALHAASEEGHNSVIKLLLDKGAVMPSPFVLEFHVLSAMTANLRRKL